MKKEGIAIFILIILGTFILVLLLNKNFLNLVSEDFVGNYILLISITLFILGFSSLQIEKKELKIDLLNSSLWLFVSFLLGLSYLAYPETLIGELNLGSFSLWAFIGGILYLFLILIKERIRLI